MSYSFRYAVMFLLDIMLACAFSLAGRSHDDDYERETAYCG